jgi:hypothetical protein
VIECRTCGQAKDDAAFHLRGDGARRSECGTCRNASRRKPILKSDREQSIAFEDRRYVLTEKGRDALKNYESTGQHKAELVESGNSAIATTVSSRIKTLDQLLEACQVDLSVWYVHSHTCNSYEQNSNQYGITTLHQVKAQLQRIKAVATEFPEITPVRIELPAVPASRPSIAVGMQTALIIPDIHVGYLRDYNTGKLTSMHDEAAIAVTLQLIQQIQPDRIVLLGDAMDLGELSIKWQATPDMQYTTQVSLNYLASLLAQMRQIVPRSPIDYICGNHEARIEKAVVANLAACYGLTEANKPQSHPVMSVPHLLGLDALGVTFHNGYPDGEVYLNPWIRCIHGTIVKQQGGETSKAILNQSMQTHTICGHIHRSEVAYKTFHTHDGRIVTRFAASPGTLGRLDGVIPAHTQRNNWQQGVLLCHYHPTQDLHSLEPINIYRGECVYRGQMLAA